METKAIGSELKPKRKKMLGIELMRGIAAFAVVLSHSGDGSWGDMSQGVVALRSFFSFHVPFFLAISFYFLSKKFLLSQQEINWQADFKVRAQRIIYPYVIWTIIYLIFRSLFFLGMGQTDKIATLYGDFVSILFFGGASYQLYFLPLLLIGTLTFYALHRGLKSWSPLKIFTVLVIGFVVRTLVLVTGNQFQLGPDIAFQTLFESAGIDPYTIPLRLIAVFSVWAITCLPYIGVALLFALLEFRFNQTRHNREDVAYFSTLSNPYVFLSLSTSIFLIVSFLVKTTPVIRPFQKLTVAFSLVLMAIALSYTLLRNSTVFGKIAANLGKCSLGIYLIHPLVIRFARLGVGEIYPEMLSTVSIVSVVLISTVSFSVSWLLVSRLIQNRRFGQYLA